MRLRGFAEKWSKVLIAAAALIATLAAVSAGDAMATADYCRVSDHHIGRSANGENFLCVKVYLQGRSVTIRGTYKRYRASSRVIASDLYYPDDPILTLTVSKRGRVVYTDDLIAVGDLERNGAHGTLRTSIYASEVCNFDSGLYSWRITMDDPETPARGQVSVNQVNAWRVTC